METERWFGAGARLPPERGQQDLGHPRAKERAGRAGTLEERASRRSPGFVVLDHQMLPPLSEQLGTLIVKRFSIVARRVSG
jgi:hypothetical protein